MPTSKKRRRPAAPKPPAPKASTKTWVQHKAAEVAGWSDLFLALTVLVGRFAQFAGSVIVVVLIALFLVLFLHERGIPSFREFIDFCVEYQWVGYVFGGVIAGGRFLKNRKVNQARLDNLRRYMDDSSQG